MTLVFGLGHGDRGDDAVGLLVADHLVAHPHPAVGARRLEGSPLQLLSLWKTDDDVIIVDAVRGGRPGAIHRYPTLRRLPDRRRSGGSHDASLVDAVELAEALGRLPRTLVVYGIAGRRFGLGDRPDGEVLAAVAPTAARIVTESAGSCSAGVL